MSAGKKCSQVGHAVGILIDRILNSTNQEILSNYFHWKKSGMKKVILKANTEKIKQLIDDNRSDVVVITDEGLTQIEPGSLTVIGFLISSETDLRFKDLSLL